MDKSENWSYKGFEDHLICSCSLFTAIISPSPIEHDLWLDWLSKEGNLIDK